MSSLPPPPGHGYHPPPPAPPGPPSASKKPLLITLGACGGLFALLLIGGCVAALVAGPPEEDRDRDTAAASSDETTPATESAAPTDPPTTPPPTEPPPPPSPQELVEDAVDEALGDSNRDFDPRFTVVVNEASGVIVVSWAIDESLTEGLTKDQAREEATSILEAVRDSGVSYEVLRLTGSYPLVDRLGNSEERDVATVEYPRSTVDAINFGGFDFKDAFEVGSTRYVHPAFEY